MAGYITRVVTVTYEAQHSRRSDHTPPHHVRQRGPLMSDGMAKHSDLLPHRTVGSSAGPCGCVAQAPVHGVWAWTIHQIEAYSARWGGNPLGLGKRQEGGAWRKPVRGRGPQDYLFNRRGAG